ncbi:hypothetical protein VTN00DRAFT_4685 [Thermoascus crustaceus]|uniref:uncharacterized protein n=1 Tax=Thermoascus crustaceus TaxID=5088 RepID=UPI00374456E4
MAPHRTTTSIHIAILDTDVPVPKVYAARGLYSSQFRVLLQAAAARLNARDQLRNSANIEIRTTAYDAAGGCLPPLELLRKNPRRGGQNEEGFGPLGPIDALLITGSSASAYELDKYPWIAPLQAFIQRVYEEFPEVKIFGSCFGHQIVAQALLSHHNPQFAKDDNNGASGTSHVESQKEEKKKKGYVSVAACPSGYEIGIEPITLEPAFTDVFPELRERLSHPDGKLRIQLIHGDRVMPLSSPDTSSIRSSTNGTTTTSTSLPSPWLNVGSTTKSPIQGLYHPSRILTYQGHFEFDTFVNRETCIEFARRGGWSDADVAAYLDRIGSMPAPGKEDDDDAKVAAEIVVMFLAGEDQDRDVPTTPPLSKGAEDAVADSGSGLVTPPSMETDVAGTS